MEGSCPYLDTSTRHPCLTPPADLRTYEPRGTMLRCGEHIPCALISPSILEFTDTMRHGESNNRVPLSVLNTTP
jgi:hypothetical protein